MAQSPNKLGMSSPGTKPAASNCPPPSRTGFNHVFVYCFNVWLMRAGCVFLHLGPWSERPLMLLLLMEHRLQRNACSRTNSSSSTWYQRNHGLDDFKTVWGPLPTRTHAMLGKIHRTKSESMWFWCSVWCMFYTFREYGDSMLSCKTIQDQFYVTPSPKNHEDCRPWLATADAVSTWPSWVDCCELTCKIVFMSLR